MVAWYTKSALVQFSRKQISAMASQNAGSSRMLVRVAPGALVDMFRLTKRVGKSVILRFSQLDQYLDEDLVRQAGTLVGHQQSVAQQPTRWPALPVVKRPNGFSQKRRSCAELFAQT
jgi:hypothetical protein